jgi:acyl-CoA thioester hydrolase
MTEFKYSIPIQPRYADFDMLGHLNNATYLTYFEVGRLHYFVEIGWNLQSISNVVAHVDIDFLVPIVPGNEILCSIKTLSLGGKSFQMQYELSSLDHKIIYSRGHSVQVCIDKEEGRAIKMPDEVRTVLANYEGL